MLQEVPDELPEEKFDINNTFVLSYVEVTGDRNTIAGKLNELIRWIKSQIPKEEN